MITSRQNEISPNQQAFRYKGNGKRPFFDYKKNGRQLDISVPNVLLYPCKGI